MTTEAMQRVETELRARGHNLKWLADALGVGSQHINNWKKRGIPRNAQQAIADTMGWTLDELLVDDLGNPGVGEQATGYSIHAERTEWKDLFNCLSKEERAALITTAKLLARKSHDTNHSQ